MTIRFVNAASVATSNPYDEAPVDAFQPKVARRAMPVDALAGVVSTGAAGAATMVVKNHPVAHALVPPAFVAFIRQ